MAQKAKQSNRQRKKRSGLLPFRKKLRQLLSRNPIAQRRQPGGGQRDFPRWCNRNNDARSGATVAKSPDRNWRKIASGTRTARQNQSCRSIKQMGALRSRK